MLNEPHHLDIVLLGKEYRVACPPKEQEALLAAVAHVDTKMRDIAEKTKSTIAERIAVMAALNIAHEWLARPPEDAAMAGLDIATVKRRMLVMEAKLDAALAPQDKLL